MRVVVPYRVAAPKERLASVLDADERTAFSRAMLADVLDAVRATGHEPTVLATEPLAPGAPVHIDDRPLTAAVNAVLAGETPLGGPAAPAAPVAVVMADLALATPASVERVLTAGGTDLTLVPGRGGGTNALVSRHPDFRVDYHGASFRDHRRAADRVGAAVDTVDSYRLSTDIDEPTDLVEVLLHGDGRAARWLREAGFTLVTDGGRVGAER